jgi:hypothetical protein
MATRRFVPIRIFLSINIVLSTAVVVLSASAALRIPIKNVSILIVVILLGLVVLLSLDLREKPTRRTYFLLFIFAFLAISYAIWPAIQKDRLISFTNDTWAYSAFGQYLKDFPRGTEGGLAPIDQYSAFLSNTRFGTPTLLSFFSHLSNRTTAEVLTLWAWLILLNIFVGIASFCYVLRLGSIPILGASVFFILCGWLPTAVFVGNLDNVLFLSILPFALVRFRLFAAGKKSFKAVAGLATTLAALFYSFPEGIPLAAISFLPWIAERIRLDFISRRDWKTYGLLLLGFVVLIAPYADTSFNFLYGQILETNQVRPHLLPGSGYFPGLKSNHVITGVFALGGEGLFGEFPQTIPDAFGFIVAASLIFLIIVGVFRWLKRDRSLIISLLAVICLACWQGFLQQYDYGLYKVLLIGSVLWIPCVFTGIERISENFPRLSQFKICLGLGGLLCISGIAIRRANSHRYPLQDVKLSVYSGLRSLQKIVGEKSIALICHEDFDQQWATFFLRNANLDIERYTVYMKAALPLMVHARAPGGPAKYVLTDYDTKHGLWHNSRLRLVKVDSRPEIIGIDAPNGIEGINQSFIWLGNEHVIFYITSEKEQTGSFAAKADPGPSRPDKLRTLTVLSDQHSRRMPVGPSFSWVLHLHPGLNKVEVWCNEQRTIFSVGKDTRNMLVSLKEFSVTGCNE